MSQWMIRRARVLSAAMTAVTTLSPVLATASISTKGADGAPGTAASPNGGDGLPADGPHDGSRDDLTVEITGGNGGWGASPGGNGGNGATEVATGFTSVDVRGGNGGTGAFGGTGGWGGSAGATASAGSAAIGSPLTIALAIGGDSGTGFGPGGSAGLSAGDATARAIATGMAGVMSVEADAEARGGWGGVTNDYRSYAVRGRCGHESHEWTRIRIPHSC